MLSRNTKNDRFGSGWLRPAVAIVLAVLSMLAASLAHAQSEDEIKAAFLLNFARYVEWPSSAFGSPAAPIRICMLDAEGFDSVVSATVDGKTVGERAFEVSTVQNDAPIGRCHILFVGDEDESAESVVSSLGNSSVFSVANDDGFAKSGGVANFFRAGNRIRFEINPRAAKRAGLKISSRLLRLAQLVE